MYPLAEKVDKPYFRLGSLLHTLLYEEEKLDKEYRVILKEELPNQENTSFQPKVNKEYRDNLIAQGYNIVTQEQRDTALKMTTLCKEDPLVKLAIKSGNIEHSFYWNADFMDYDGVHVDLPLKTRTDIYAFMNNGSVIVIDPKSTADLYSYNQTIAKLSYPQQAAMQCDGIQACLNKEVSAYYYLFVSTDFPFDYRLVQLSMEDVERGRMKNQLLLSKIKQAILTDNWIPDRRVVAELPGWYV